jgi:hypothetical protein
MKLLLTTLLLGGTVHHHTSGSSGICHAFVSPGVVVQHPSSRIATTSTVTLYASEEAQSSSSQQSSPRNTNLSTKPPVEPGSHQELMYTLGVNLARQLGDIRPLVEDGDELAQVAKGLLDTVVGRLTEDGQKALLASRGKDLNALISDRA